MESSNGQCEWILCVLQVVIESTTKVPKQLAVKHPDLPMMEDGPVDSDCMEVVHETKKYMVYHNISSLLETW